VTSANFHLVFYAGCKCGRALIREAEMHCSALPKMRLLIVYLISAVALVSVSCKTQKPNSAEAQKVAATATPTLAVYWSEDLTDSVIDNEALRLAWKRFESRRNID